MLALLAVIASSQDQGGPVRPMMKPESRFPPPSGDLRESRVGGMGRPPPAVGTLSRCEGSFFLRRAGLVREIGFDSGAYVKRDDCW